MYQPDYTSMGLWLKEMSRFFKSGKLFYKRGMKLFFLSNGLFYRLLQGVLGLFIVKPSLYKHEEPGKLKEVEPEAHHVPQSLSSFSGDSR